MARISMRAAAAAVLFSVVAAGAAKADIFQTYNLAWSGTSFNNAATATGLITLDLSTLPNPGGPNYDLLNDIVSLSVTVAGDGAGDGTWTKADLAPLSVLGTNTYWDTGGVTLDMASELVGQTTSGNPWGTSDGASGDFNLFFTGGPIGSFYFTLQTSLGAPMLLTEFDPVTSAPEPITLSLFGAGLAGAMALRRHRSASKA